MTDPETFKVKTLKKDPSMLDRMERWGREGAFNAVAGPKFWLKEIGLFKAKKKGKRWR